MSQFGEMMKQAKAMQEQLQQAQEELANLEVTGESGAGMVKVTLSGRHEARRVQIDPSLLQEDREVLEDLVAAAINDAVRRVENANREKMSGLASGLSFLQGMKPPFL